MLERRGAPVGVVTTITGQTHAEVCFRGEAGHAGTVPMNARRDALAAAAEWMLAVESVARRRQGTVATVGRICGRPRRAQRDPGRGADDARRPPHLQRGAPRGDRRPARRGAADRRRRARWSSTGTRAARPPRCRRRPTSPTGSPTRSRRPGHAARAAAERRGPRRRADGRGHRRSRCCSCAASAASATTRPRRSPRPTWRWRSTCSSASSVTSRDRPRRDRRAARRDAGRGRRRGRGRGDRRDRARARALRRGDRRPRPARAPGRDRRPRALQRARPDRLGGLGDRHAALAAGGATACVEMPLNAHPPTVDGAAFDAKVAAARAAAKVDFALWGGLVPGPLERMDELAERGVAGFKAFMCDTGIDDFDAVDDDQLGAGMERAARARAAGRSCTPSGPPSCAPMDGGDWRAWVASRPPRAELAAIERAIALADARRLLAARRARLHRRRRGRRRRGAPARRRRDLRDLPALPRADRGRPRAARHARQVRAAAAPGRRARRAVGAARARADRARRLRPLAVPAAR